MKCASTQYSLDLKAFEIYLSGCKAPHCLGCHNPELWCFNLGDNIDEKWYEKIEKKIKTHISMIDKIIIMGGEPLDQNHEDLKQFLLWLKQFEKEIWIFTKNKFEDIPEFVKNNVKYIKSGRYIKGSKCKKIKNLELSSDNQFLYEKDNSNWKMAS